MSAAEQGVELVCTGISDSRGCALAPRDLSIAEVLEAKAAFGSVAYTASHGYIICYSIGAADTATPGTMLMDLLSIVDARNKKPVFKRG